MFSRPSPPLLRNLLQLTVRPLFPTSFSEPDWQREQRSGCHCSGVCRPLWSSRVMTTMATLRRNGWWPQEGALVPSYLVLLGLQVVANACCFLFTFSDIEIDFTFCKYSIERKKKSLTQLLRRKSSSEGKNYLSRLLQCSQKVFIAPHFFHFMLCYSLIPK